MADNTIRPRIAKRSPLQSSALRHKVKCKQSESQLQTLGRHQIFKHRVRSVAVRTAFFDRVAFVSHVSAGYRIPAYPVVPEEKTSLRLPPEAFLGGP